MTLYQEELTLVYMRFIFQKSGSDMEEKMEMELREKALQSLKRQRSNNDDA